MSHKTIDEIIKDLHLTPELINEIVKRSKNEIHYFKQLPQTIDYIDILPQPKVSVKEKKYLDKLMELMKKYNITIKPHSS